MVCVMNIVGLCVFGFFLGRIVTYLWISHRSFVVKSCGGGFRKFTIGWVLFWYHISHSHCILLMGVVVNTIVLVKYIGF